MTSYFYIPFPSKDLRDNRLVGNMVNVIYSNLSIFDDNGAFIGQSRGHFMERKCFRGIRPLSAVGKNDTLVISAHGEGGNGNPTNPNVIAARVMTPDRTEKNVAIEVAWLAQRIQKDGLTPSIKKIELSVCYSGLDANTPFGGEGQAIVNPEDDVTSATLASQLAIALGNLGYKDVIVSGATGEVVGTEVVLGTTKGRMYTEVKDGKTIPHFIEDITKRVEYANGNRKFDTSGKRVV